jgi:hypothetical protein
MVRSACTKTPRPGPAATITELFHVEQETHREMQGVAAKIELEDKYASTFPD